MSGSFAATRVARTATPGAVATKTLASTFAYPTPGWSMALIEPGCGLLYPYPGLVAWANTVWGPRSPGAKTRGDSSAYSRPVRTGTPTSPGLTPQSRASSPTSTCPAASVSAKPARVLPRETVSSTTAKPARCAGGLLCPLPGRMKSAWVETSIASLARANCANICVHTSNPSPSPAWMSGSVYPLSAAPSQIACRSAAVSGPFFSPGAVTDARLPRHETPDGPRSRSLRSARGDTHRDGPRRRRPRDGPSPRRGRPRPREHVQQAARDLDQARGRARGQ